VTVIQLLPNLLQYPFLRDVVIAQATLCRKLPLNLHMPIIGLIAIIVVIMEDHLLTIAVEESYSISNFLFIPPEGLHSEKEYHSLFPKIEALANIAPVFLCVEIDLLHFPS
jgi:hypothetical protein